MKISNTSSLKQFNTFGLEATANKLVLIENLDDLKKCYDDGLFNEPHKVLGGGSNILLCSKSLQTVFQIAIRSISFNEISSNDCIAAAKAGESWADFVDLCVSKNLGGLENLSLIPGNVGAAPMQNIGAYGVEIKDCFVSLDAFNKATGEIETFTLEQCDFGYRYSVFKDALKDKFIITSVSFKLTRKEHHLKFSYGAINEQMSVNGDVVPTISTIAKAVKEIRQSKLPDPKILGNSGSFFKNPVVSEDFFRSLQKNFPIIPGFKAENETVKLSAAWLIETCGFKGIKIGEAGVHALQALVLVNYGDANGNEIWELAKKIMEEVSHRFGIDLEPEVNIW